MIKSTEAVKAQVVLSCLKAKEPKLNYLQSTLKKPKTNEDLLIDPEMEPLCQT